MSAPRIVVVGAGAARIAAGATLAWTERRLPFVGEAGSPDAYSSPYGAYETDAALAVVSAVSRSSGAKVKLRLRSPDDGLGLLAPGRLN